MKRLAAALLAFVAASSSAQVCPNLITLRSEKGSPLTWEDGDNNFENVRELCTAIELGITHPRAVDFVDLPDPNTVPGQLYAVLDSDGSCSAGSSTITTLCQSKSTDGITYTWQKAGLSLPGVDNAILKESGGALAASLLNDNGSTVTLASGQLLLPDGTVLLPSVAFSAAPSSGLYRDTQGVSISGLGEELLRAWNNGGLQGVRIADSASTTFPGFSWLTDTDTGFDLTSPNQMSAIAGANYVVVMDDNYVELRGSGRTVLAAKDTLSASAAPLTCGDDNVSHACFVQMSASQAADGFVVESSAGTDYLAVQADGNILPTGGFGSEATVLGDGATSTSPGATTYGRVAIGRNANANTNYSLGGQIAIGDGATTGVNQNYQIAIGRNANTGSGANSIAIGASSSTGAGNSVALGYSASYGGGVNKGGGVALGQSSNCNSSSSVCIGASATATGQWYGMAIGSGATTAHNYSIALGFGSTTTATNQLVIDNGTGGTTSVFVGDGVTSATPPTDVSFGVTGGSGTDIAGSGHNIDGGIGTGAGAGGPVKIRVAPAGTTGTSPNALVDALTIEPDADVVVEAGQLLLPDGSAGAPSIAFDDGSGIYQSGTSQIAFNLGTLPHISMSGVAGEPRLQVHNQGSTNSAASTFRIYTNSNSVNPVMEFQDASPGQARLGAFNFLNSSVTEAQWFYDFGNNAHSWRYGGNEIIVGKGASLTANVAPLTVGRDATSFAVTVQMAPTQAANGFTVETSAGADKLVVDASGDVAVNGATPGASVGGQAVALNVTGYTGIGGLRLNGADTANTIYSDSSIGIGTGAGQDVVTNGLIYARKSTHTIGAGPLTVSDLSASGFKTSVRCDPVTQTVNCFETIAVDGSTKTFYVEPDADVVVGTGQLQVPAGSVSAPSVAWQGTSAPKGFYATDTGTIDYLTATTDGANWAWSAASNGNVYAQKYTSGQHNLRLVEGGTGDGWVSLGFDPGGFATATPDSYLAVNTSLANWFVNGRLLTTWDGSSLTAAAAPMTCGDDSTSQSCAFSAATGTQAADIIRVFDGSGRQAIEVDDTGDFGVFNTASPTTGYAFKIDSESWGNQTWMLRTSGQENASAVVIHDQNSSNSSPPLMLLFRDEDAAVPYYGTGTWFTDTKSYASFGMLDWDAGGLYILGQSETGAATGLRLYGIQGTNTSTTPATVVMGGEYNGASTEALDAGEVSVRLGWSTTTGSVDVMGDGQLVVNTGNLTFGADSATPTDRTIQGQSASGTDVDGAALQIAEGVGTGTGSGGGIAFQYAPPGTTGSSLNTLETGVYLEPDTGNMRFANDSTFWVDVVTSVYAVKLGGVNDPNFTAVLGGVYAYAFDAATDEEVFASIQAPHCYKEGSDVYPHVHWAPDGTSDGVPANQAVRWCIEYTAADVNTVFPTTATACGSTTEGVTEEPVDNKHYLTALGPITPGAGWDGISNVMMMRVYRDANDAADTYENDAWLVSLDTHFECDSLGTDELVTK